MIDRFYTKFPEQLSIMLILYPFCTFLYYVRYYIRFITTREYTRDLRAGILQKSRQSQRVHPLIHAFATVSREMVSPHVRVLGLEGELLVDFVLGLANGNSIRR